jgi:hypothetical protein
MRRYATRILLSTSLPALKRRPKLTRRYATYVSQVPLLVDDLFDQANVARMGLHRFEQQRHRIAKYEDSSAQE